MKNKPKILYRPLPANNETLKSYLLRVAYENGYETLNLLGRAIGQHIGPALFRPDFPDHEKLVREVKKHLCLTADEFKQCELSNTMLMQNHNHVVNMADSRTKVCIECLKEAPILDKKWEVVHTNHCMKHQCELEYACPSCHKPFTKHTTLFEGCAKCGLNWANVSKVKVETPIYQQVDESLSKEKQKLFRAALYQMLVFVSRPLDLHLAVYQRIPSFIIEAGVTKYFNYAYKMLVNEKFAHSMLKRRMQHCREQGNIKLLSPSLSSFNDAIQQSINSVSLFIPQRCFEKAPLPNSLDNSDHYKNKHYNDETDYPFKIEHQVTAYLLGISASDLNDLSQEGLIEKSDFVGVRSLKWFDIRNVESNLQSIANHVQFIDIAHKRWINLYDLKPTLQRYNLSFAKALKLLITNRLQIVTNVKRWELTDLKICREEATQFFEEHFIDSLSGPIKKRDILNYFQFNGKQFEAFKSRFADDLIFDGCSFGYIPGESIKAFFDDHILLNKQCLLQKANVKKCVSELKIVGLLPADLNAANSELYIYKKTHHIQAAITAITTRLSQR